MHSKLGVKLAVAAALLIGTVGCGISNPLAAKPTETATRTPRPTFTPLVQPTNTFVPLPTALPTLAPLGPTTAPTKAAAVRTATRTPTKKPPTPKPATSAPPTAVPPTAAPVASQYEFHVNPAWCEHSGMVYIKGTVYLDKNDPNQRYDQAIVALGPPDGSTIYDVVKSGYDGVYSFILSGEGAPPNKGTFGVWLVFPDHRRKSDIGGPITIDGVNCWAGHVDFWR